MPRDFSPRTASPLRVCPVSLTSTMCQADKSWVSLLSTGVPESAPPQPLALISFTQGSKEVTPRTLSLHTPGDSAVAAHHLIMEAFNMVGPGRGIRVVRTTTQAVSVKDRKVPSRQGDSHPAKVPGRKIKRAEVCLQTDGLTRGREQTRKLLSPTDPSFRDTFLPTGQSSPTTQRQGFAKKLGIVAHAFNFILGRQGQANF